MSFSNQLNTSKEQYKKAWSIIILGVINYNWREEIGINLVESDHEDLCSFSKSFLSLKWFICFEIVREEWLCYLIMGVEKENADFLHLYEDTMYNKKEGKKVMWFRISKAKWMQHLYTSEY